MHLTGNAVTEDGTSSLSPLNMRMLALCPLSPRIRVSALSFSSLLGTCLTVCLGVQKLLLKTSALLECQSCALLNESQLGD